MIVNLDKNTTTAAAASARHRRHLPSPSLSTFSSSSSSSSSSYSSSHHRLLRGPPLPPKTLPSRRSPLSTATESDSSCCSGRLGEVAGGTAAECAVICCCCPCGLVNLLILTVYKVPTGLLRRVLRRKRRERMKKQGLLLPRARKCQCGCDDTEIQMHPGSKHVMLVDINGNGNGSDKETPQGFEEKDAMVKLEKEMWERFYGTGFWRSPSQREPINVCSAASSVLHA